MLAILGTAFPELRGGTALPDFASVNFSEEGTADLCDLLLRRGIGIEAGLSSVADARAFIESGITAGCVRILVEPDEEKPVAAIATAAAIDELLNHADIAVRQLHHGYGMATWAVIGAALDRGHDIRVGLEDTLELPDGSRTRDNAELVTVAARLLRHGGTGLFTRG